MPVLDVLHLQKTYASKFTHIKTEALRDLTFHVQSGEFVAIMGESGSGKTTLLNLLAGLDSPTGGQILVDGIDLHALSSRKRTAFRRNQLGIVFQDYSLLETFSLRDNIALPLKLNNEKNEAIQEKIDLLARTMHIETILDKYPDEVSGGQKQRAAVARALITGPQLLLADEPTGALDSFASRELLELFARLNANGQTIVMVTHSAAAASFAQRVLVVEDGQIIHELQRGAQSQESFYTQINRMLMLFSQPDQPVSGREENASRMLLSEEMTP